MVDSTTEELFEDPERPPTGGVDFFGHLVIIRYS